MIQSIDYSQLNTNLENFKLVFGLHQPALKEYRFLHITIGETVLKTSYRFTYSGCIITSDAKVDREIDNRLAKSNNAFDRLCKRV